MLDLRDSSWVECVFVWAVSSLIVVVVKLSFIYKTKGIVYIVDFSGCFIDNSTDDKTIKLEQEFFAKFALFGPKMEPNLKAIK